MSPSLLNLVPNAVGQAPPRIIYAEVTSPVPTSLTDPLFLLQPDWSPDFAFRVDRWEASHGNALPAVGDAVLMIGDNRGIWRVAFWDHHLSLWGGVELPTTPPPGPRYFLMSDGGNPPQSSWGQTDKYLTESFTENNVTSGSTFAEFSSLDTIDDVSYVINFDCSVTSLSIPDRVAFWIQPNGYNAADFIPWVEQRVWTTDGNTANSTDIQTNGNSGYGHNGFLIGHTDFDTTGHLYSRVEVTANADGQTIHLSHHNGGFVTNTGTNAIAWHGTTRWTNIFQSGFSLDFVMTNILGATVSFAGKVSMRVM